VLTHACPWRRNNDNLGRLSCKIISPLVFAHVSISLSFAQDNSYFSSMLQNLRYAEAHACRGQVRAAMPGMPVSEQNCHPFQFGRYMWMHNGMV
jgi:hypothetical protein